MKTYLITPFAEKEMAKALGARWDPARKAWYVEDVADLSLFARWFPGADAAQATRKPAQQQPAATPRRQAHAPSTAPTLREEAVHAATALAHCGCEALPWEHCVHTRA